MAVGAANLGFPRMGKRRELKFALEKYWTGELTEDALAAAARELRRQHWQLQSEAGIALPPSNDFSFYDHVLDMAAALGAVPARFESSDGPIGLSTYFAMARGSQAATALEMTKWFDTNYHYVVPEFEPGMRFNLRSTKACRRIPGGEGAGHRHASRAAWSGVICAAGQADGCLGHSRPRAARDPSAVRGAAQAAFGCGRGMGADR